MAKVVSLPDVSQFFRALMEKGAFRGIFGLRRAGGLAHYCLFADAETLEELSPWFPLMPVNAARSLVFYTFHQESPYPVAFIGRPCEIRAVVELAKLEQLKLENILLVGVECVGVYPQKEAAVSRDVGDRLDEYLNAAKSGSIPEGVRESCKLCMHFVPENVDITVSLIGREQPVLVLHSERAIDLAEELGFQVTEGEERTQAIENLLSEKQKFVQTFEQEFLEKYTGVEGVLSLFSKCIACHNCRSVCPICYCRDCFFDSATFDYEPESYERRVTRQGTVRVPMDTLLFHLGRMTHMATSCVGCGMCEDACPVGIPVSRAFKFVGKEVQALFDYVPGRSLEEELPLTTYRVDELHEVEDR